MLVVRHRHVGSGHPQYGGVELVEGIALDQVHHLRSDPRERPTLFRDDAPAGPAYRGQDRFPVSKTDQLNEAATAATQYSSVGHFDLTPDQALVITLPATDAPYLGFQLGSLWYISLDYINHQTR